MTNPSLRTPPLPDKPSRGALVFLYSLYALSAGAILAVGLANGHFWPGVPAAWGVFAALLSFAAFIRSKWAIDRWPWLGPDLSRVPTQPAELEAEIDRLRAALKDYVRYSELMGQQGSLVDAGRAALDPKDGVTE